MSSNLWNNSEDVNNGSSFIGFEAWRLVTFKNHSYVLTISLSNGSFWASVSHVMDYLS